MNGLNVEAINPRRGAKYSPNLYQWLTHRHAHIRSRISQVYQDAEGTLWIGWVDKMRHFIGSRLLGVLANGARETCGIYGDRLALAVIADFWPRYVRDGRCAIDVRHAMGMAGDDLRWTYSGDMRSCRWCGNARQTLKRWTQGAEFKAWA